jgi:hypothetical protein
MAKVAPAARGKFGANELYRIRAIVVCEIIHHWGHDRLESWRMIGRFVVLDFR